MQTQNVYMEEENTFLYLKHFAISLHWETLIYPYHQKFTEIIKERWTLKYFLTILQNNSHCNGNVVSL